MSSVIISGDTSGAVTLAAPAAAGTNTITLPAASGELSLLGGAGQTWQNLTATRSLNSDNTNLTGRPIQVVVSMTSANGGGTANTTTATALVGGVIVAYGQNSDGQGFWTAPITFSFIVPAGAVYKVNTTAGSGTSTTLNQWAELR